MGRFATLWAGAWLAAAVSAAAEAPVPFPYVQGPDYRGPNIVIAEPDEGDPEEVAQRAAEADLAEAACDGGDLAGCTALGKAYLDGSSRPMNRPVGELLLRQACDGAEAAGCRELGNWLVSMASDIAPPFAGEARTFGLRMLGRACMLGELDACVEEARAVEAGPNGDNGDRLAAMALRRAACARGSGTACSDFAAHIAPLDAPDRDGGILLLEEQCRSGIGLACEQVPRLVDPDIARGRAAADAGCLAGHAPSCRVLGAILFAAVSGPPEGRTAALAAFDSACALDERFCLLPEQIRTRPLLAQGCAANETFDCIALARIYSEDGASPLHSPAEAAMLFGKACEADVIEACSAAVAVMRGEAMADTPDSDGWIAYWHDTACRAGSRRDCVDFGKHVLASYSDPDSRARGYEALTRVCETGDIYACDDLDEIAAKDPDAPLLSADARFGPPLSEEQIAELAAEAERAEDVPVTVTCRSSAVVFRGVLYEDRACVARAVKMVRGFLVPPGSAPWQALLWRPERVDGRNVPLEHRLECGGALIATGWVVTAAHCVVDARRRPIVSAGYTIRLGVNDAYDLAEGASYRILRLFPHDLYVERGRVFDVALIQFDPLSGRRWPPPLVKTVPVDGMERRRLPLALEGGMTVYAFGWGNTALRGENSQILKGGKLALQDLAVCSRKTSTDRAYLAGSLLCASAPDRTQVCDGDSGGPLISYARGGPVLVGVVSAGTDCGQTGVPSRFTRLSVERVRSWIADVLAGRVPGIVPR